VRFEVLAALWLKMQVCHQASDFQHFKGSWCLLGLLALEDERTSILQNIGYYLLNEG